MNDKFHKLLEKKAKEGKSISPMQKDAKMGVLKDLHKMASDSMANKLGGMKKVSVMAPDEHGLEAGLDKAKDLVGEMPDMVKSAESGHSNLEGNEEEMHQDFDGDDEMGEDPEHVAKVMGEDGDEEMSLDEQIAALMAKKAALQEAKKA